MRVLIVDGNAKHRSSLARLLAGARYMADSVGTLAAARRALARAEYDLVLLELQLPDGDGETLVRQMRADGLAMPVLVGTAVADLERRIAVLDSGADGCMVKPFSADELLARARALLRRPPGMLRGASHNYVGGMM